MATWNATAALAAAGLTIGTRRDPGGNGDRDYTYTGVLRRGTHIAAECGHTHTNRDESSRSAGTSARDCITSLVKDATLPSRVDYHAQQITTRWMRLGPYVTPAMREQVKAAAPAEIAAYRALVAHIAELLNTGGAA